MPLLRILLVDLHGLRIAASIARISSIGILVISAIRHADAPTRRRVGCVLELLEAGGKRLDKLHKKTPETRSVIPLDPGGNRIGTINKRWGVILNQTDWLHG